MAGGLVLAGRREHPGAESSAGAQVLASYAAGPLAGRPAVTRHEVGPGSAWYLSTQLDDAAHDELIGAALAAAGLAPEVPGRHGRGGGGAATAAAARPGCSCSTTPPSR